MPYDHASMLLLGEGSEPTEPYNKYDKIRPHSIRSLQFDQKVRPLSFRPETFDLFTATQTPIGKYRGHYNPASEVFQDFQVSHRVKKTQNESVNTIESNYGIAD